MTPWQHFPSGFLAKMITNPSKSFRKHPQPPSKKAPKNPKASNVPKTDFYWKTLSSKVDLTWQLWPIRKVENTRTVILFLSSVRKKLKKTGLSRPKHSLLPQVFDLDPSFSWKSPFSFGALFDLFLVEHTASCGGYDMILK